MRECIGYFGFLSSHLGKHVSTIVLLLNKDPWQALFDDETQHIQMMLKYVSLRGGLADGEDDLPASVDTTLRLWDVGVTYGWQREPFTYGALVRLSEINVKIYEAQLLYIFVIYRSCLASSFSFILFCRPGLNKPS